MKLAHMENIVKNVTHPHLIKTDYLLIHFRFYPKFATNVVVVIIHILCDISIIPCMCVRAYVSD